MERGQVWWADIPDSEGSGPAMRRPVVIVQADPFNRSRLQTVIAAMMTTNLKRGEAPGNVTLSPAQSGLSRESVVNVSQLFTLDKSVLTELVGPLPAKQVKAVDDGLKLVLGL